MDTLFIPNEGDFRRWIKDAVKECLENIPPQPMQTEGEEPLLTRKEIAGMFRISLVTLHDWMKRGLPCHSKGAGFISCVLKCWPILNRKAINP